MGEHFILDLYGVDPVLLEAMQPFIDFIRPRLDASMATVLTDCSHKFEPGGYTYLALLSTSHFSAHSWPEKGSIALDMFSCGQIKSEDIIKEVTQYFQPKDYVLRKITR